MGGRTETVSVMYFPTQNAENVASGSEIFGDEGQGSYQSI